MKNVKTGFAVHGAVCLIVATSIIGCSKESR